MSDINDEYSIITSRYMSFIFGIFAVFAGFAHSYIILRCIMKFDIKEYRKAWKFGATPQNTGIDPKRFVQYKIAGSRGILVASSAVSLLVAMIIVLGDDDAMKALPIVIVMVIIFWLYFIWQVFATRRAWHQLKQQPGNEGLTFWG